MIEGWKYYNYAVVPTTAPHEEADISCIKSRTFWIKCGGGERYHYLHAGRQILIVVMKRNGGTQ